MGNQTEITSSLRNAKTHIGKIAKEQAQGSSGFFLENIKENGSSGNEFDSQKLVRGNSNEQSWNGGDMNRSIVMNNDKECFTFLDHPQMAFKFKGSKPVTKG